MFQAFTGDGSYGSAAVAILPLGATENHGSHLPLTTDTDIADGILDRAAAMDSSSAVFLRLRAISIGASAEHADRPGTISIEPEVLVTQIEAIGGQLAARGLRKLLLFNAHGGNIAAASIAALKLRRRFGLLAASAHWLDYALPPGLTPPTPAQEDVHGGWMETSIMLHLAPRAVGTNPAAPAKPPAACLFPTGPVNWGWMTSDMAADGYIGRPDLADVEMGRVLVDHAARKVLETLQELSKAPWT